MIDDAALLSEIQNDPAELGYAGAGARPIIRLITAAGSASVEAWVPSPSSMILSKAEFLKQISSFEEVAALGDTESSTSIVGKALKFLLAHTDTIDMSLPANRALVVALTASDDVPVVDTPLKSVTANAMLRLGEVLQSRAQELWGEFPLLEQIKGVL